MTLLDDIAKLQGRCAELDAQVEKLQTRVERQDEQINGERGISAAITAQTKEISSLRKAAYWVAGLIVAGSIGFAFSVLLLINSVPTP